VTTRYTTADDLNAMLEEIIYSGLDQVREVTFLRQIVGVNLEEGVGADEFINQV